MLKKCPLTLTKDGVKHQDQIYHMPEIPGKEVSETDLIPGIRYWIVAKSNTHSGVFSHYYRNIISIPTFTFKDVYVIKGKNSTFPKTILNCRIWHPYKSLNRYYEVRKLTDEQKNGIQEMARHMFELGSIRKIYFNTELSLDVAIDIAKYIPMI